MPETVWRNLIYQSIPTDRGVHLNLFHQKDEQASIIYNYLKMKQIYLQSMIFRQIYSNEIKIIKYYSYLLRDTYIKIQNRIYFKITSGNIHNVSILWLQSVQMKETRAITASITNAPPAL